jgi:hypothetical protein
MKEVPQARGSGSDADGEFTFANIVTSAFAILQTRDSFRENDAHRLKVGSAYRLHLPRVASADSISQYGQF